MMCLIHINSRKLWAICSQQQPRERTGSADVSQLVVKVHRLCGRRVGGCRGSDRTPLRQAVQGIRCGQSMWVCIERLSARTRELYLRENLCRTFRCIRSERAIAQPQTVTEVLSR